MGAWGTVLHVERIGEGDLAEAFYALRDEVLEHICKRIDVDTVTGLDAYLSSEEFHVWQSDRFDATDESHIFFAFWDDDPLRTAEYARHCFDVVFASERRALDRIARAWGFALGPTETGSSIIVEAAPWCRGQPIDTAPRLVHAAPGTLEFVERSSRQTQRALQAVAMTGRCLCPLCTIVRSQRRMPAIKPAAKIANAWELLDREATGAALAADAASRPVLADWLEERGITLIPEVLEGLAETFRTAERYVEPIRAVLVLREDTYETQIGDGYFAYFSAAFRERADALRWISVHTSARQHAYHVREAVLEARGGAWQMATNLEHHEHASLSDVLAALGLPVVPTR